MSHQHDLREEVFVCVTSQSKAFSVAETLWVVSKYKTNREGKEKIGSQTNKQERIKKKRKKEKERKAKMTEQGWHLLRALHVR